MDFLVSLVGRTLLNLKTFLDGTEMMEDSLYEGQMRYIPEEAKEDKNFVEKIVYVSPIRHAEGNFCDLLYCNVRIYFGETNGGNTKKMQKN